MGELFSLTCNLTKKENKTFWVVEETGVRVNVLESSVLAISNSFCWGLLIPFLILFGLKMRREDCMQRHTQVSLSINKSGRP